MSEWVVDAQGLTKVYQMGDVQVHALRGLSLQIAQGEVIAIMGPSGSGKSTLMNILGCLDRPTDGEYYLGGERVSKLSDDQLASIRNRKVGFVFQGFNLLPRSTALANVEMPLRYRGGNSINRRQEAQEVLEAVGLGERLHHRPSELSGGQQQRVAIARALGGEPSILLADEPTGNLDSKNGEAVMELLRDLHRNGATICMVTHDPRYADFADRTVHLFDGKVVEEQVAAQS